MYKCSHCLVTSLQTFSLFPSSCERSTVNTCASVSLEVQSSENLPRVDIAGSCLVYFPLISLRNLCTDLHSGCTNLYFYQQSIKDFSFSILSPAFVVICLLLTGITWNLKVALICTIQRGKGFKEAVEGPELKGSWKKVEA